MKKQPSKTYVFWIMLTEAVGALSGWLSRTGMQTFQDSVMKPPLSPPGWVFPIAWGILYALMGIGMAKVRMTEPSRARERASNVYLAQLILNFFWSLIFFNAQAYGLAVLWLLLLWVLVLVMIRRFRCLDPLAAKLQLPYLLWLTFAAYLSIGVWYLNA